MLCSSSHCSFPDLVGGIFAQLCVLLLELHSVCLSANELDLQLLILDLSSRELLDPVHAAFVGLRFRSLDLGFEVGELLLEALDLCLGVVGLLLDGVVVGG